jgi:secondary thiamine-phosphate synthase enzyme
VRTASSVTTVTAPAPMSYIDVTDDLRCAIKDAGAALGFAVAYCAHTTCGLIINEWEDGVLSDLRRRLEALVPTDDYYAHDDLGIRTQNLVGDDRANGRAHVAQMILGNTSHTIPIEGGEPCLGRWQRLFLVELDEPKPRTIRFHVYCAQRHDTTDEKPKPPSQ